MLPSPPHFSDVAQAPHHVIGYHGCHVDVARRILQGEEFVRSTNAYDWLGSGIYFWEYGPYRAWEWAWVRYGEAAAVLKSDIALGHCLNLLDTGYFRALQLIFHSVANQYEQANRPLPANRRDKRHFLDRAIIDEFCEASMQDAGIMFQTVRGCFPEGEAIYPGSKILRETHVQIAVRDPACLSGVELVEYAKG